MGEYHLGSPNLFDKNTREEQQLRREGKKVLFRENKVLFQRNEVREIERFFLREICSEKSRGSFSEKFAQRNREVLFQRNRFREIERFFFREIDSEKSRGSFSEKSIQRNLTLFQAREIGHANERDRLFFFRRKECRFASIRIEQHHGFDSKRDGDVDLYSTSSLSTPRPRSVSQYRITVQSQYCTSDDSGIIRVKSS